jgi:hypothetical protein
MLKKLINIIKTKKTILITILVIFFVVLLIALGVNTGIKESSSRLPFFTKRQQGESTAGKVKARGGLTLVRTSPPNDFKGLTWDNNSEIIFFFNMPVDEKSLRYTITPSIMLDYGVYKNNPDRLWMKPRDSWYVGIEHTIVINDLSSTTGEYIGDKIIYKYYTKPDKVIKDSEIPD